jgi:hypothetical protein
MVPADLAVLASWPTGPPGLRPKWPLSPTPSPASSSPSHSTAKPLLPPFAGSRCPMHPSGCHLPCAKHRRARLLHLSSKNGRHLTPSPPQKLVDEKSTIITPLKPPQRVDSPRLPYKRAPHEPLSSATSVSNPTTSPPWSVHCANELQRPPPLSVIAGRFHRFPASGEDKNGIPGLISTFLCCPSESPVTGAAIGQSSSELCRLHGNWSMVDRVTTMVHSS